VDMLPARGSLDLLHPLAVPRPRNLCFSGLGNVVGDITIGHPFHHPHRAPQRSLLGNQSHRATYSPTTHTLTHLHNTNTHPLFYKMVAIKSIVFPTAIVAMMASSVLAEPAVQVEERQFLSSLVDGATSVFGDATVSRLYDDGSGGLCN
jgi:hypothetical protein